VQTFCLALFLVRDTLSTTLPATILPFSGLVKAKQRANPPCRFDRFHSACLRVQSWHLIRARPGMRSGQRRVGSIGRWAASLGGTVLTNRKPLSGENVALPSSASRHPLTLAQRTLPKSLPRKYLRTTMLPALSVRRSSTTSGTMNWGSCCGTGRFPPAPAACAGGGAAALALGAAATAAIVIGLQCELRFSDGTCVTNRR